MTQRCSICDIAHDETSRCPTDLEYERGYRAGFDRGMKEVSQQGHPTPCTLGPLCPYCEIARLTQRLAAAEARLAFTPSPEQWQETQSQLRAAQQRLAAAEGRYDQLCRATSCYNCADMRFRLNAVDATNSKLQEQLDDANERLAAAEVLLREAIKWAYKPSCTFTEEDNQAMQTWFERAQAAGGTT